MCGNGGGVSAWGQMVPPRMDQQAGTSRPADQQTSRPADPRRVFTMPTFRTLPKNYGQASKRDEGAGLGRCWQARRGSARPPTRHPPPPRCPEQSSAVRPVKKIPHTENAKRESLTRKLQNGNPSHGKCQIAKLRNGNPPNENRLDTLPQPMITISRHGKEDTTKNR